MAHQQDQASITLTCAATTRQPSAIRAQLCICRPSLPGEAARWNNVDAVAKSRPNVVIAVRLRLRMSPALGRAARNAAISAAPYRTSAMP